jgi:hypothetical protein
MIMKLVFTAIVFPGLQGISAPGAVGISIALEKIFLVSAPEG